MDIQFSEITTLYQDWQTQFDERNNLKGESLTIPTNLVCTTVYVSAETRGCCTAREARRPCLRKSGSQDPWLCPSPHGAWWTCRYSRMTRRQSSQLVPDMTFGVSVCVCVCVCVCAFPQFLTLPFLIRRITCIFFAWPFLSRTSPYSLFHTLFLQGFAVVLKKGFLFSYIRT